MYDERIDAAYKSKTDINKNTNQDDAFNDVRELLIIGAGPHSLTLILRLLEPDPDFLSEKQRHRRSQNVKQLRPMHQVKRHIKHLIQGPSATLKHHQRTTKQEKRLTKIDCNIYHPPLKLADLLDQVMIVDSHGEWLHGWKQNFDTIGIPKLRSLMNAHADPYDYRSLEYFAEMSKRGDELVTLADLSQRNKDFSGPYQVPSTSVFNDFHDLLIQAYGVQDLVQKGSVESICPKQSNIDPSEALFEVVFRDGEGNRRKVKSKRVVCAMGPNFSNTDRPLWEQEMQSRKKMEYPILHAHEIIPWIRNQRNSTDVVTAPPKPKKLLIVGGGITSAQLALLAVKSTWFRSVTLIQRSKSLARHFDVENEWMGPLRGKLLDHFWSLDMDQRAIRLKEARRGGSIPPDILNELLKEEQNRQGPIEIKEEVEILDVEYEYKTGTLKVTFDNNVLPQEFGMIWLATGSKSDIKNYPAFESLLKTLPTKIFSGLPVLDEDLCLLSSHSEPEWKQNARKSCWFMGALAALELGTNRFIFIDAYP